MQPNVMIYTRAKMGAGTVESLSRQFWLCRKTAQQLGSTTPIEFQDLDPSKRRPGLQAVLRKVRQGQIRYLVVDRPDRLSHRLDRLIPILQEMAEYHVEVKFADPDWQGALSHGLEKLVSS